jgi:hypothetical protein
MHLAVLTLSPMAAFKAFFGSNQAQHCFTRVNAHPKGKLATRRNDFIQFDHRGTDRQGSPRGPQGVIDLGDWAIEPGHHGVSKEFFDRALFV